METVYLEGGPFDYQYQDMGAMRFPESIQYAGSNETLPVNDVKLVFQLADMMNQLNQGRPDLSVNFIPWIENNTNGLYYFDGIKTPSGLPLTVKDIGSAKFPGDPLVAEAETTIQNLFCNHDTMKAVANNVFTAHKAWLDNGLGGLGGDDWSESAYIHKQIGSSLNVTDQAIAGAYQTTEEIRYQQSAAIPFGTSCKALCW